MRRPRDRLQLARCLFPAAQAHLLECLQALRHRGARAARSPPSRSRDEPGAPCFAKAPASTQAGRDPVEQRRRREAVPGLGVRGVQDSAFRGRRFQPAGVHADAHPPPGRLASSESAIEPMRRQTCAPSALGNEPIGGIENDSTGLRLRNPHGHDHRETVRCYPAEQHVRQARRRPRRSRDVDSRARAATWWGLRCRRRERQWSAVHLGRSAAVELGPGQDPFDCNLDVEAQRPHAEPRLPQRVKVLPGFHTLPDVRTHPRILGNWFRKGGIALDQYVFAAATRSALPGVKGDRNSRISPYPLELLPHPDRAVEHRQRPRGSITKGEVRQRRQDDATRGGDVPERHDTVAPEDVIDRYAVEGEGRAGNQREVVPGENKVRLYIRGYELSRSVNRDRLALLKRCEVFVAPGSIRGWIEEYSPCLAGRQPNRVVPDEVGRRGIKRFGKYRVYYDREVCGLHAFAELRHAARLKKGSIGTEDGLIGAFERPEEEPRLVSVASLQPLLEGATRHLHHRQTRRRALGAGLLRSDRC